MRALLTVLTFALAGCVTPLPPRTSDEVIVMCVMTNCKQLMQTLQTEHRRVTVVCVLAKCQPLPPTTPKGET